MLLTSVDGLRPDYVTQAKRHGLKVPNLSRLLREGVHASVIGVLPSVTYPSHTTMVTGVAPARHGIFANRPFDRAPRAGEVWYWFKEDIRVPTLWDAAAASGYVTGNVSWPVSVGAPAVHFNIPEYARTRDVEDLKMLRALATPRLLPELEKRAGPYVTDVNQGLERDRVRTRYAVEMMRTKGTRFITVHLAATDHAQHASGPFSPEALEAVEGVDKMVGELRDAIRSLDPRGVICVVSDHGFARVDKVLKLDAAFVKAGLITLKVRGETLQTSEIANWVAMPWISGGSAAIVLKDPKDETTRARVADVLRAMASDPNNGIAEILDRRAIARLGGTAEAEFWITSLSGFAMSASLSGPIAAPVKTRGAHGHSPANPDLRSFFLMAGEGIRKGADLGEIDMRSIAPTLARAMNVPFPAAEAPALEIGLQSYHDTLRPGQNQKGKGITISAGTKPPHSR